jgi:hypothetical protein
MTNVLRKKFKNLELISLERNNEIEEKSILFFLQEIQAGAFPNLKGLNLSKMEYVSLNCLSVINQLIIAKKMNILVTPKSVNISNYFKALFNDHETVKLNTRVFLI